MLKVVWIVVCTAIGLSAGCGDLWQLQGQSLAPSQARSKDPQAGSQQPPADSLTPPETKPAPPTPIAIQKVELGDDDPWNPAWDKLIEQSLPPDLLSPRLERQVKPLCPRFKQMSEVDRRAFWAYFFQALAGAEAGLRPTANVRHTEPEVAVVDPVTHRIARQEGLLQLAYIDGERYGCDFHWEKDKDLPEHDPGKTILLPENNLECGIKILDNQLIAKHKPLLSKSSYWETLRPGGLSFAVFVKQLANMPAACGVSRYRPRKLESAPETAALAEDQPTDAGKPATTGQPAVVSKAAAGGASAAVH
jgi:hypothetical protein